MSKLLRADRRGADAGHRSGERVQAVSAKISRAQKRSRDFRAIEPLEKRLESRLMYLFSAFWTGIRGDRKFSAGFGKKDRLRTGSVCFPGDPRPIVEQ